MSDRSEPALYTRTFLLLAGANFLLFANLNAYTLLPVFIVDLGEREGAIGSIMAMYPVGALVSLPLFGAIFHRIGAKALLMLGAVMGTAVSAAFAAWPTLGGHLYVLRFLQGAAFACFSVSNLTLIARLAPPSRRAEALGVFGISGLLTMAVVPTFGEAILHVYGAVFYFSGTVAIALATLAVCAAIAVPRAEVVAASQGIVETFRRASKPVLVVGFLFGLGNAIIFVFVGPIARGGGVPRIAPFFLAYTFAGIAARFIGARFADRFPRRYVVVPCLMSISLVALLFCMLTSTWALIVIGALAGVAQGVGYTAAGALAIDRATGAARGRTLNLFTTVVFAGAVGALPFGWVIETIGTTAAFIGFGAVIALGAAYFGLIDDRARPAQAGGEALGLGLGAACERRAVPR